MSHSPSQRGDAPVLYDKGENPPQKILARIRKRDEKELPFRPPMPFKSKEYRLFYCCVSAVYDLNKLGNPFSGSPSALKVTVPVTPSTVISVMAAIRSALSMEPACSIAALITYTVS